MAEREQTELGKNLACLVKADEFLAGLRLTDGSRVPRSRITEFWGYLRMERDEGRVDFKEVMIDGEPYLTLRGKKSVEGYVSRFDVNTKRGMRAIDQSAVGMYANRQTGVHRYE